MKNRRILSTLLAIFVLAVIMALFSACKTDNGHQDESRVTDHSQGLTETPGISTKAPDENAELEYIKDGKLNFSIIRNDTMSDGMSRIISKLVVAVNDKTGVRPQHTTDFIQRGHTRSEEEEKTPAILIGDTNYPASADVMKLTGYNGCVIRVVGKQLVVGVRDSIGLSKAVTELIRLVNEYGKDGALVLPSDYSYDYTGKSLVAEIPVCNYGYFKKYTECGDDSDMVVYRNIKNEDYKSYISDAKAAGLEVFAENQIANNLFATLTKDELILNAVYTAADKELRLIADSNKNTTLPVIDGKDKEGNLKCTLTQLGLEYNYDTPSNPYYFTSSIYQIGMCYIFGLNDGSFVIIDGGYNKLHNSKMLYTKLRELAPNGKINIAAWLFSHHHGDHYGIFKMFMKDYGSMVNVEYVIYNSGNAAQTKSCGDSVASMGVAIKSVIPNDKIIIARPGQKFRFRNMDIEMYFTSELMPDIIDGGNSLCIAFRAAIEGQTFFFAGDSYPDMTAKLVKYYGNALASDFEQVIHHGGKGNSNDFHRAVNPIVALWPLGEYDYFPSSSNPGKITRSTEAYNAALFESSRLREIILAGHTTRTILLPYKYPDTLTLPTASK